MGSRSHSSSFCALASQIRVVDSQHPMNGVFGVRLSYPVHAPINDQVATDFHTLFTPP